MIHIVYNEGAYKRKRFYKITTLPDILEGIFQSYVSEELICVYLSLLPFRRSLRFRQHMKNCHKFGMNLSKLCWGFGYINNIRICICKQIRHFCHSKKCTISNSRLKKMKCENKLLKTGTHVCLLPKWK